MQDEYQQFQTGIEQATNEIHQKNSVKTQRTGFAGLRDKFTFFKVAIFFAYGYISIIQTMIIFLGITPQAIMNVNGFLVTIGIAYQFPVDVASFVAIAMIVLLFVMGVMAMLYLGLFKREQEIGSMQHPGFYLLAKQNEEIIRLLKEQKK